MVEKKKKEVKRKIELTPRQKTIKYLKEIGEWERDVI